MFKVDSYRSSAVASGRYRSRFCIGRVLDLLAASLRVRNSLIIRLQFKPLEAETA